MFASICGPTCGFPLFVHVFGAMVLVGGVATVMILPGASLARPPAKSAFLRRLAFATTLIVVWPGLVTGFISSGNTTDLNNIHIVLPPEQNNDLSTPPQFDLNTPPKFNYAPAKGDQSPMSRGSIRSVSAMIELAKRLWNASLSAS